MRIRLHRIVLTGGGLLLGLVPACRAQGLRGPQLDSLVTQAMQAFDVPGVALAIVQDGQVVCAKGYGVRVAGRREPVEATTLFGIASNSKAFTTAALGLLVDEGKLGWDDKVIDHLPEFRLYDPYVTADCTVRDLLTHRSGLGLGAGDLMRTPDSTQFTLPQIMYNLRYLKPVAPFRSRYAYDNILYLVAGELVARVSGQSWPQFVEQRLLAPLHMRDSRATFARLGRHANVALGHQLVSGHPQPVRAAPSALDEGAGGIYASATDLTRWLLVQLGQGQIAGSPRLYSAAVAKEMWTPQTIIPASKGGAYNTHFGAYGLGWFLVDVKGYQQVFHTGEDVGMISAITLLPELGVGLAVLTNQEGGGAVQALTDQLVDAYVGVRGTHRVQEWAERVRARAQTADQTSAAVWQEVAQHPALRLAEQQAYVGTYRDPWLGDVRISARPTGLWFQALRSPQLRGPLQPYRGTAFAVRWSTPQLHADAFVVFRLDAQGQAAGMSLQAISPSTPPAYDFTDLSFRRVSP